MLDFGFYNMDCMEGMKEFPDNYFDLAVVDPPYGSGRTGKTSRFFDKYKKVERTGGGYAKKYGGSIRHKSRQSCTNGCSTDTPTKATKYLIHMLAAQAA